MILGGALLLSSLIMILLVLIQRGRGGGLAGAFGGMGGQSALGVRAGDVFTKITIVVAVFWVLVAGFLGIAMRTEAEEQASGTALELKAGDSDSDAEDGADGAAPEVKKAGADKAEDAAGNNEQQKAEADEAPDGSEKSADKPEADEKPEADARPAADASPKEDVKSDATPDDDQKPQDDTKQKADSPDNPADEPALKAENSESETSKDTKLE